MRIKKAAADRKRIRKQNQYGSIKRLAEMILVPVAVVKNTNNAMDCSRQELLEQMLMHKNGIVV